MKFRSLLVVSAFFVASSPLIAQAAPASRISGEAKMWHRVTLDFDGPLSSEGATPNPFRDYRLDVTFSKGEKTVVVPGYFAADGNAGESGAEAGRVWRVHFAPDESGTWNYRASFRSGSDVAIAENARSGQSAAFDGASGTLEVAPSDKSGRDFRGQGALRSVGERYFQFAGSKKYFLKNGADSPENLLGYVDFDQTPLARNTFSGHARDWKAGDPTWRGGKGKNLIGALNYLASQGLNASYFLTMNVDGDTKDVWPWVSSDVRDRFDVSKLDQWETVFGHMNRLGLLMHVVLQENENDKLLDGGDFGPTKRLYYREMIARFSHHPALTWNIGEENSNSNPQRKSFAQGLKDLDPYDHPVILHWYSIPIPRWRRHYAPLLGFPALDGPGLQTRQMPWAHDEVIHWLDASQAAGRQWVVSVDEPGHDTAPIVYDPKTGNRQDWGGVRPDALDPDHNDPRRYSLWGTLMAGGAGVEWYFGWKFEPMGGGDGRVDNYRAWEAFWAQTRIAFDFFNSQLPFSEMGHADALTPRGDDYVFAKDVKTPTGGEVYAIYQPDGAAAELDFLYHKGSFRVQWFNPREGGALQNGNVTRVEGGRIVSLGEAPSQRDKDWVILVTQISPPQTP